MGSVLAATTVQSRHLTIKCRLIFKRLQCAVFSKALASFIIVTERPSSRFGVPYTNSNGAGDLPSVPNPRSPFPQLPPFFFFEIDRVVGKLLGTLKLSHISWRQWYGVSGGFVSSELTPQMLWTRDHIIIWSFSLKMKEKMLLDKAFFVSGTLLVLRFSLEGIYLLFLPSFLSFLASCLVVRYGVHFWAQFTLTSICLVRFLPYLRYLKFCLWRTLLVIPFICLFIRYFILYIKTNFATSKHAKCQISAKKLYMKIKHKYLFLIDDHRWFTCYWRSKKRYLIGT